MLCPLLQCAEQEQRFMKHQNIEEMFYSSSFLRFRRYYKIYGMVNKYETVTNISYKAL